MTNLKFKNALKKFHIIFDPDFHCSGFCFTEKCPFLIKKTKERRYCFFNDIETKQDFIKQFPRYLLEEENE